MATNDLTTGPAAASHAELADLPVQVDVAAGWGAELVAWLEGDLRWQVVPAGGALRPQARITDDVADRDATVVLVGPASMPAGHTRRAADPAQDPSVPVLSWPADRGRLVTAVHRAVGPAARVTPAAGCRVVHVGGVAAGLGTSTVALALGGLAAWRGARALVTGDDDLLTLCGIGSWSGPGLEAVAALSAVDAAREVAALGRPVPGVPRLHVLGGGRPALPRRVPWPLDVVVVDRRTHWRGADVVVVQAGEPVPVVPATCRVLVRAASGPRRRSTRREAHGWLAEDPRVRRAAAAGRVPAGLPGRWLGDIEQAVRAGAVPAGAS